MKGVNDLANIFIKNVKFHNNKTKSLYITVHLKLILYV